MPRDVGNDWEKKGGLVHYLLHAKVVIVCELALRFDLERYPQLDRAKTIIIREREVELAEVARAKVVILYTQAVAVSSTDHPNVLRRLSAVEAGD